MLHTAVAPLLPASVVTHTVSGYFLPSSLAAQKEKEVIAIRQNYLTLYRVKGPHRDHAAVGLRPADELGQVAEVSLHAPPLGAATCRPFRAISDILVLLFDDFHVSFLQYNPVKLQFDTVALVQLDDRQLSLDRCPLDAMLRVDETGTFLAVLAKRSDLFFFPVLEMVNQETMAAAQAESSAANVSITAGGSAAFVGDEEAALNTTSGTAKAVAPKPTVALNAWGDEDEDDIEEKKESTGPMQSEALSEGLEPLMQGVKRTGCSTASEATPVAPLAAPLERSTNAGGSSLLLRIGTVTHWSLQNVKTTLRNIRDVQFVESAGEPLLAFLFERQPTWAGRVKLLEWRSKTVESHMLTCSIEWMKITLANSSTPHMLSLSEVDGLPYDVTNMTPLPAFQDVPSAVLCVSRNMVMHVSTKSGYGVFLNAVGEEQARNLKSSAVSYEAIQWRSASQASSTDLVKVNLNLANASTVLLSQSVRRQGAGGMDGSRDAAPRDENQRLLVVTEEEGTVVDIHLHSHGYTVSSISAEIVMTGCFCSSYGTIDSTSFFLGSLNGDSRFIQSTPQDPCKVLQKFVGIGPVRDVDIVDTSTVISGGLDKNTLDPSVEASPYADLYRSVDFETEPVMTAAQRKAVMDIAVCSGTGSAGSLSILRRSIRSRVVRQEELNAISVFFLEHANEDARKRPRDSRGGGEQEKIPVALPVGAAQHPHLLITGSNFSILFAVRSDSVQQVRGAALSVSARTVYATQLDWLPGLLQVTETELRLLSVDGKRRLGSTEFQTLPAIQRASSQGAAANVAVAALLVADMHCVLVRFTDGQLLSFSLQDAKAMSTATLLLEKVVAVAWWGASTRQSPQRQQTLLVVQNMDLIMYHLQSPQVIQQVSSFPNFALLPPFAVEGLETPMVKLRERLNSEPLPTITHLSVFDQHEDIAVAAAPTEATWVIILSSGELVTYRVVPPDANGPRRCVKLVHHILDVAPEVDVVESIEARKKRLQEERALLASVTQQMRHCSERLVPLRNLQGRHKGIYVCGQTPVFLLYHAATNQLVCTRHHAMSAVRGFAPFHSRHVHGGFVYCGEGFVHFATMQPFGELLGSSGWWLERVRLGCTPHQLVYSPAAHGCFVVSSRPQPFSPKRAPFDVQLRMIEDEEGNRVPHVVEPIPLPPLSATSGVPVPTNERYEVLLFSTLDWQCMDRLLLDTNEKVLSATLVQVSRDTTMDAVNRPATAPVCALATAYPLGEDVTTRGRVLLLATSQKDRQGTQQLRTLHEESMKGPVTAIARVSVDCVAVAVGGTVRVYRYDAEKSIMETMAILYAGAYVTSLQSMRDYLLIGDLFNSVLFARYNEDAHSITVLGRDTHNISVVSQEMLYHDTRLGILVADDARNLICMSYKPRVLEEPGKPAKVLESLLSVTGEYRLAGGSLIKMMRLKAASAQSGSVAIYVTNMGEIGYLVPLGDQTSRTGQWVLRRLQTEVAHVGGLPPRMFLGFPQSDPLSSLKGEEWMLHVPLLEQLYRQDLRSRKLIASAAQTQLLRVMNVGATVSAELWHV